VVSKRHLLAAAILISTPVLLCAASQDTPSTTKAAKPAAATRPAQQYVDQGDRVFHQQCSRCHNAPEGFSPRISGTIIRHMRVRASLSKQDEEELLRFLNP
jgi:mono/diheme cytochrome c family protein